MKTAKSRYFTNSGSGISCQGGPMKTGMQPESTASVKRLLEAVSPGGIKQKMLRCMAASSWSYGICMVETHSSHAVGSDKVGNAAVKEGVCQ